jgi:hypothetical protein
MSEPKEVGMPRYWRVSSGLAAGFVIVAGLLWLAIVRQPLGGLVSGGIGGACGGEMQPPFTALDASGGSGAVILSGHAWSPPEKRPTRTIILADDHGRMVGLGKAEPSPAANGGQGPGLGHDLLAWRAEVGLEGSSDVTAYLLVDSGHRACAIGRVAERSAEVSSLGGTRQAQAPLGLNGTTHLGSFTRDGQFPGTGSPPSPGAVYGSWSGADANIGSVALRYNPLPASAIAVLTPVLQGPGQPTDLFLRARLLPSGQVLAFVQPSGFYKWGWWRIALPQNLHGQQIEIDAIDGGYGYGQWLAVGSSFAELSSK